MDLPKRILVPTDFSAPAAQALDYAVRLAEKTGAKVTVVHAHEIPVLGFADGALVPTGDIAERMYAESKSALDALVAERGGRGVDLTGLLKSGDARDVIPETANAIDADLIVMGTHGRRGLSRALLGSVAESVVRTATRPVLTVRAPEGKKE